MSLLLLPPVASLDSVRSCDPDQVSHQRGLRLCENLIAFSCELGHAHQQPHLLSGLAHTLPFDWSKVCWCDSSRCRVVINRTLAQCSSCMMCHPLDEEPWLAVLAPGQVGDERHGHAHIDPCSDGDGQHSQEEGPPGGGAGLVKFPARHSPAGLEEGRQRGEVSGTG